MAGTNGNGSNGNGAKIGTDKVKQGLAQMLKGGVIVSFHRCCVVFCSLGLLSLRTTVYCHMMLS